MAEPALQQLVAIFQAEASADFRAALGLDRFAVGARS